MTLIRSAGFTRAPSSGFPGTIRGIRAIPCDNGRTARPSMNLVLIRARYIPIPVRTEDRLAYVRALQQTPAGQRIVAQRGSALGCQPDFVKSGRANSPRDFRDEGKAASGDGGAKLERMPGALSGKIAVVTGSSRGIGRAIALRFAREGAAVVVHGTDAGRAGAVVDEIAADAGRAAACLGDVADDGFGEKLAAFAVERFGGIDVFVANAGTASFAPFLEMKPETFRWFLDVHVTGAFTTSQAAAKQMAAAGRGGRILYMSSISAVNAMYGYAGYCSAKSAVMALTRVAALELAEHRITANAIAPGPVQNEMMEQLWGPERLKERSRGIPLGRIAQTEDVAEMAVFLASPGADYITGQTFFVDGGALAAGLYTHEVYKRS